MVSSAAYPGPEMHGGWLYHFGSDGPNKREVYSLQRLISALQYATDANLRSIRPVL